MHEGASMRCVAAAALLLVEFMRVDGLGVGATRISAYQHNEDAKHNKSLHHIPENCSGSSHAFTLTFEAWNRIDIAQICAANQRAVSCPCGAKTRPGTARGDTVSLSLAVC